MSLNVKTFLAHREKFNKKYYMLYCYHSNYVGKYGKKKKKRTFKEEGGGSNRSWRTLELVSEIEMLLTN